MMNTDIKNRWITALRSGDYAQAKDTLRFNDGFCCLGVLCDIAVKDGVIDWVGMLAYADEDDSNDGELPQAVVNWAGLETSNPVSNVTYPGNVTRTALFSELNDDMDMDFLEIADVIESQQDL